MDLYMERENEVMADVIRIKKKDVRRILSLYAIDGLSQKETGRAVFGREEIQGVSTYAVVQRVLHYFGLNMEHRRDYTREGLTEDIIDRILDNRTIAFPLAVPVEGGMNPAVNFDAELNKYLGGDRAKWNILSQLKNFAVVALLAVFTYFLVLEPNEKDNYNDYGTYIIGMDGLLCGNWRNGRKRAGK